MFWLARDWPKSIGGVGGGGMRFWALCKGWVVQFSATPCKTQPAGIIASSETQGQSVESGERARRKFSSTGERAPGYRLSPNYFQKFKRMPAPDWAQKMLCIIVPNRRTVSPEFFSWVRTRRLLFQSRLVWLMHQRNAGSQETFSLIWNPHLISKYCLPEN